MKLFIFFLFAFFESFTIAKADSSPEENAKISGYHIADNIFSNEKTANEAKANGTLFVITNECLSLYPKNKKLRQICSDSANQEDLKNFKEIMQTPQMQTTINMPVTVQDIFAEGQNINGQVILVNGPVSCSASKNVCMMLNTDYDTEKGQLFFSMKYLNFQTRKKLINCTPSSIGTTQYNCIFSVKGKISVINNNNNNGDVYVIDVYSSYFVEK